MSNLEPIDLGGPCLPWVSAASLGSCADGVDAAVLEDAIEVATELLWAFSGRRYGASCEMTVTPCLRAWCGPTSRSCAHPCDVSGTSILLPAPVYAVDAVLVDGEPFTDFEVIDHRWLRRTDGLRWHDAPGVEIVLRTGLVPPRSGIRAARILACEFVKAATGGKCRLPERVRSVSRQGVTMDLIDPQEFLVDGRLGILEVDVFLVAVNPSGLNERSRVYSPDVPRPRRR